MDTSRRIYVAILASVTLWCLSIIGAPILGTLGGHPGEFVAGLLYAGFSRICHQLDTRSLHILGLKLGVCIRCTSIYFSFLAGTALYPVMRSLKVLRLPRQAWLVIAVVPMAIDAALNDLGILPSTEASRVVTGSLAGFVFAFFIVPLLLEALPQILTHRTLQGDTRYVGKTQ